MPKFGFVILPAAAQQLQLPVQHGQPQWSDRFLHFFENPRNESVSFFDTKARLSESTFAFNLMLMLSGGDDRQCFFCKNHDAVVVVVNAVNFIVRDISLLIVVRTYFL